MGKKIIDQYSILHLAVGIVAYFWGISIKKWIIIHIVFEYIENTAYGIVGINTYLKGIWPGGKQYSDSLINIISDNVFAIIGWILAYYIDKMGKKNKWHQS